MERLFGISAIALTLTGADAGTCKPVTTIHTRAVRGPAKFENGKWEPEYGMSGNVDTASLNGAFYYIIAETIDKDTGYGQNEEDKCKRKNGVSFIHFYSITMCNPDAALWYFGQSTAAENKDAEFNLGEYGQYLTFDGGKCGDDKNCGLLTGENEKPKLGPFVGWQDQTTGERNPTKMSYWYSIPGDCPNKGWSDKDDECKTQNPGGLCKEGETPDGEKCTWSYEMLGQVNLDELVGITKLTKGNGETYKNATEYCQDGKTEFKRDENNEFVEGLPFWEGPKNQGDHDRRLKALRDAFGAGENNKNLPTVAELKASNPRCYESTPGCFDENTKTETCTRDDEMLCVPCADVDGGCAGDVDATKAFPKLEKPDLTIRTPKPGDGGDEDSGSGASTSLASLTGPLMSLFAGLALFLVYQ